MNELLAISVVSHGQLDMIAKLLGDLEKHCANLNFKVILTLNIPENELLLDSRTNPFSFPIEIIRNKIARGFGENHNNAFASSDSRYFAVLNPDIRLVNNPFDALLARVSFPEVGVISPLVLNSEGQQQDSARKFPTVLNIVLKCFYKLSGIRTASIYQDNYPDWLAGMFLVFRSEVFAAVAGFDPAFFLYYEDVDLSGRINKSGLKVEYLPQSTVVHDAQRASHRNLRYLKFHIASLLRFWCLYYFTKRYAPALKP